VGQIDSWKLTAEQGDYVTVIMTRGTMTSASFQPWLRLVGPTGRVVSQSRGSPTTQFSLNIPATATYTVLVADWNENGTGDYRLTLTEVPRRRRGEENGPALRMEAGPFVLLGSAQRAATLPSALRYHSIAVTAGEEDVVGWLRMPLNSHLNVPCGCPRKVISGPKKYSVPLPSFASPAATAPSR
jgi:hypothetical protein